MELSMVLQRYLQMAERDTAPPSAIWYWAEEELDGEEIHPAH